MKKLSDRNLEVLSFIQRFIKETRYPPTLREIMKGIDAPSTSVVNHHLSRLEEFGRIIRVPGTARGIVICDSSNVLTPLEELVINLKMKEAVAIINDGVADQEDYITSKGVCPICGEWFATHGDSGECIQD